MKKTNYQGISTLEVLEGADNYNKWIADTIDSYSKSHILELGAGTGNISDYFVHKKQFSVTEYDIGLVTHLRKKYKSKKNVNIFQLNIEEDIRKRHREKFNTVFAVNVFEHIKNDKKAFRQSHALLKKNGRMILLVPAKKFAYTRLDKSLGHHRRYEKDELYSKLTESGFFVEKLYYFNIVGLISWLVRDKIEKQHVQLSPSHIAMFDRIVPILRRIEARVPIPIGISLIAIAKKK